MPSDKERAMAQKKQTDVIGRVEDALQKLTEMPGSTKVLEAVHAVRERLEDLQVRIRSLDPLERRVAALERRLDELAGPGGSAKTRRAKPAASKTTGTKTSAAAKRKPAAKKTSS
jgi:hypothetical protein